MNPHRLPSASPGSPPHAANGRFITYSPSVTIPITRSCIYHCLYCGYRSDGEGILSEGEVRTTLEGASRAGLSEVLIMSGEAPWALGDVRTDLLARGYEEFVPFLVDLCRRILRCGLLPHTNVGVVSRDALCRLRQVNASLGLMVEGVNPHVNRRFQPGKDLSRRLRFIEWAGELTIPFTSGILIGMGESQDDRIEALGLIVDLDRAFGHIQEVIIQNYVPNLPGQPAAYRVSPEEYQELIAYCRSEMPEVGVQIPPNLNPLWPELVRGGATDLGGIASHPDVINHLSPWEPVERYKEQLLAMGFLLRKRLPLYPRHFHPDWYAAEVGRVLATWVEDDEYDTYLGTISRG